MANAEILRVSIYASVRSAAVMRTPDHMLTKVESSRIVATDLRRQESRWHGRALRLGRRVGRTVRLGRAWPAGPHDLLCQPLRLRCPEPCDQSCRSACPGQWRVWPYPIYRRCAGREWQSSRRARQHRRGLSTRRRWMAHAPRRTERAGVGGPIDGSDSAPAGIAAFAVLPLSPDTKIYQQDEVRGWQPRSVTRFSSACRFSWSFG